MKSYYEYGLEKVAFLPAVGYAGAMAYPTIMNTLGALGGAYTAYELSDALMKWMYGKFGRPKKAPAQNPARTSAPSGPPKDAGGGVMGSGFGAQVKAFQKPQRAAPVAAAPAQAPAKAPAQPRVKAPERKAEASSLPGFRNAPAPQGAEPGGVWGMANTPEGKRKVYMGPSALKSPVVHRDANGAEKAMSSDDYARWYHEKYGPPLKRDKPEPTFNYGTWAGGAPRNPKVREAIRNGTGIFRPSAVEGNR